MKPVMQTRFGWPEGNCTEACLASMLGLDIEEVPDLFVACDRRDGVIGGDWIGVIDSWLRTRGLSLLWIDLNSVHGAAQIMSRRGEFMHLMSGGSPRIRKEGFEHMVVAVNGRMVHDPHPDGSGLEGKVTGHGYIVKLIDKAR